MTNSASPRLVARRSRSTRFFGNGLGAPASSKPSDPEGGSKPATPYTPLNRINVDNPLDQEELASGIRAIAPQGSASSTDASPTRDWDAFELMRERIHQLSAILAAPTPDVPGWPGGWQGSSAFADDVRRIATITEYLYTRWRLPPDSAEEALEYTALRVIRESGPEVAMPPDRTGWRRGHTREPGGPFTAVVMCLTALASAAFTAGFDHRALLTGRRILGVTIEAVASDNATFASASAAALRGFLRTLRDVSRCGGAAGTHRCVLVIGALIADLDPLITAVTQFPKNAEAIRDVIEWMPWLSEGNPYPLASAAVGAHLIANGWTVNDNRKLRYSDHPTEPPLLSETDFASMFEQLQMDLRCDDPMLPLTYLFALWAQAIIQVHGGEEKAASGFGHRLRDLLAKHDAENADTEFERADLDTATRLRNLIEQRRGDRDDPPRYRKMHPRLRALIETALGWSGAASADAETGWPLSRVHLRDTVRRFLTSPHFTEATYHGLADTEDGYFVVVEELDGSRRLLRTSEAAARSPFAWRYDGTGPWELADTLAKDILGDQARCPWCFGTSVYAARQVRCRTCNNSGLHPALYRLTQRLYTNATSETGQLAKPIIPGAAWSMKRSTLLAAAAEVVTSAH